MRLELAGSLIQPDPLVLRFESDLSFVPADYIDLGYTHFEVICIGAGGGMGGGINTANTGTLIRSYGGAGGGGGFQRVRGLLSALPSSCPVVVGAAGDPGMDHASNPALTTDGDDGEYSAFNNNTCRASGGKGGKRVQSNSLTVTTQADGGQGGVGNRTIAGGGAAGGTAGTPSATGPGTAGTAGVDGTIFNNIGKGGGGGAGGVGKWIGITCNAATAGGRGSYNPGDTSIYGPGYAPTNDIPSGAASVIPGSASGAKASALNGLPIVYGKSGDPGIVVIRLTADVVSTIAPPVTPPVQGTKFGAVSRSFTFVKTVRGDSSTSAPDGAYGDDAYGAGPYAGLPQSYGNVSRAFTFGKAVSGSLYTISPKSTPVAEISLASHGTPSARTNHTIRIRARITSGYIGVIKAALYEGANNRSGDLTSEALTTSLADYTLTISNAAAATITSYSNLSIKIWGYTANGAPLVFEVSRVYLELPTP